MPIGMAIIGYGKIARDQHVPAIAGNPGFQLVAVSSRNQKSNQIPSFRDHREMFEVMAGKIDAVVLSTPPNARLEIASDALAAGLHVLVEKPPAATLGEAEEIARLASRCGRTLFAAWHSQRAPAVEPARQALAGRRIETLKIEWHEDVRKWHPGQQWIWEPGGFGVFDPGINALSIASRILPRRLFVRSAELLYPANRQTPIAARIVFGGEGEILSADFDWRRSAGESWTIRVEAEGGRTIDLTDGGERLQVDGREAALNAGGEYPSLYERFAELIEAGDSEVDLEPLRIVADAFLVGERRQVEPFD